MQRPGRRIRPTGALIAQDVIERYERLSASLVSDVMGRTGTPFGTIDAIVPPDQTVAGTALTVHCRAGDNLLLHKALQMASPGTVVVVAGQGDHTAAYLGHLMALRAARSGVSALVVDGLVRDLVDLRRLGLPIFARGITPRGPTKAGLGEINVPIAVDGVVVEPGDLVVGDHDGIAVVPLEAVEHVCGEAEQKQRAEAEQIAAIEAGRYDAAWIDVDLQRQGYEL